MPRRLASLIVACAAGIVVGCTTREQTYLWSSMSMPQREAVVTQMTGRCRLPRSRVQLLEDDGMHLRLEPTDDYDRFECLLKELERLKGIELGFVGNEAFVSEVK